jgi:VWFA-related protein
LLASTAVVAAMGGWLTAQSSAPPADTAGVNDFTSVDVHVVDSRTGNAPRGLTEQDFDLRIDGVPTPIRVFSDDPGPLRLSILIDLSHSADVRDSGIAALMSRALDRVLFTSLRPEDRVQMGGLGSRMVLTPFLSDRVELVGAVDQVIRLPEGEEFGPSPLWDQLDEVCRVLSETPGRRAVLLISDGRATGNRIGLGIIALRLAVADVTVNAIGEASPMIIRQDEKTMVRVSPDSGLKALADATGGLFVPGVLSTLRFGPEVPSFDPAPQIEPIIAHLRSAYVLRFASASHDGNLHTIEVRMK